jgi:cysteine desulfurase family protein (TIGR01976 family)
MVSVSFDVDRVRAQFPALRSGTAFFDGPGGSQTPRRVAHAVAAAMGSGLANRGSVTAAEQRADAIVLEARQAMADLLGCPPSGVVFGRSMTQLTYDVSRALAKQWSAGDEVVVTRLDHDANVRPWVQAAQASGAVVRWAAFDRATGRLAPSAVEQLLSRRTRLVAVTAASNLLGARPDVAAIAEAAHAAGALVYVDGVHLTPHAPVDVGGLDADFYACSPYKFFGPHLGVLAADPLLWDTVQPDKLLPATNAVPERFEHGTLPYELLAGTTAAVDFIAELLPAEAVRPLPSGRHADETARSDGDNAARVSRRERVLGSMAAVEEYEDGLLKRLLDGLQSVPSLRLHGSPGGRTPTVLFTVDGRTPQEVYEFLASRDVNAPAGSFYAIEASRWMGLGEAGAVRAGLAPYTNDDDVDRLVAGVRELTR